jgi:N-methylhydantoinase A/oxoprolinase/acetone carboxylase beta subunit
VVFPHSSVFSAFGAGLLPIAHSYQTVVPAGAGEVALRAAVARLADNARRDLRAEGVWALDGVRASLSFGSEEREDLTLDRLLDVPEALVARNGGLSVAVRVALNVSVPREAVVEMITRADAGTERNGEREVLTGDGAVSVPVIEGLGDPAAAPVSGPAFLRAPDTTIFVPSDWSATFTRQGYGILSKEQPG